VSAATQQRDAALADARRLAEEKEAATAATRVAVSDLGDTESSLGDAKSSLGDVKSSAG
jgi:hypothetical protein